jgi:hypothetical protein
MAHIAILLRQSRQPPLPTHSAVLVGCGEAYSASEFLQTELTLFTGISQAISA